MSLPLPTPRARDSDDGRFIGTNVLNEAFLERFPVTFEQGYPNAATEFKIIYKTVVSLQADDSAFCQRLVDWADIIRKTFFDGGVDEVISTSSSRSHHPCLCYLE